GSHRSWQPAIRFQRAVRGISGTAFSLCRVFIQGNNRAASAGERGAEGAAWCAPFPPFLPAGRRLLKSTARKTKGGVGVIDPHEKPVNSRPFVGRTCLTQDMRPARKLLLMRHAQIAQLGCLEDGVAASHGIEFVGGV